MLSAGATNDKLQSLLAIKTILRDEAIHHRCGQLRQCRSHSLNPRLIDRERRQIGIGEIAIILRVLLAAHRARLVPVGIVKPRLLHDGSAVLDQLDLAADFELDRMLKKAKAVEVLDLAARSELRCASGSDRYIGVETEAAFLHV